MNETNDIIQVFSVHRVTRLAMPRSVKGNCSHEPGTVPILGGANLLWAEVGANPRDIKEKTEEGRGHTVSGIRKFFEEGNCQMLEGPSRFFV